MNMATLEQMNEAEEAKAARGAVDADTHTGQPRVDIVDRRSKRQSSSKTSDEISGTKKSIRETRASSGPEFLKNAKVVDLIAAALKKRADSFHDSVRGYLFLRDSRV